MCAKGRNPVTEEYCRRWFSEDDLFRVLSQEGVPVFIKSPFVRMLHGVYFSASASDEAAAAADSMHAAGREDHGASGVMSRYWGQIARLFHSIEQDVTRFRLWVPYLPTSPYISLHLPTSPYISLHLPTSPYISLHLRAQLGQLVLRRFGQRRRGRRAAA